MSTIGPKLVIELVENKATGEFAAELLPHPHLAGLTPVVRTEPRDLKVVAPRAADATSAASSPVFRTASGSNAGIRDARAAADMLRDYQGSTQSAATKDRIAEILAQARRNNDVMQGRA